MVERMARIGREGLPDPMEVARQRLSQVDSSMPQLPPQPVEIDPRPEVEQAVPYSALHERIAQLERRLAEEVAGRASDNRMADDTLQRAFSAIEGMRAQAAESDQAIAAFRTQQAELEANLEELRSTGARREREVMRLVSLMRRLSQTIDEQQAQAVDQATEVLTHEARVHSLEAVVAERDTELAAARSEIESLRGQLAQ